MIMKSYSDDVQKQSTICNLAKLANCLQVCKFANLQICNRESQLKNEKELLQIGNMFIRFVALMVSSRSLS